MNSRRPQEKFTYEERRRLWMQEIEAWEQETENFKDYGLCKSFELDEKYKMSIQVPVTQPGLFRDKQH